jgi:hypothetical protein
LFALPSREEAYSKRKGNVKFEVVKRPTGPIASKYTYEKAKDLFFLIFTGVIVLTVCFL